MFEVYVLVCIISTKDCTELIDTRGPYETRAECLYRALEMSSDFGKNLITGTKAKYSYKCKKVSYEEI